MAGDFPSKPMSLYATIWDASDWATSGGKYKVNYKYAPFVAEFTDLTLHGCAADPIQEVFSTTSSSCSQMDDDQSEKSTNHYAKYSIGPRQRAAMRKFRQKYMYYSYCYDTIRYPIPPPECVVDPLERRLFKETGRLKFEERHRRHSRRSRSQVSSSRNYGDNRNEDWCVIDPYSIWDDFWNSIATSIYCSCD